ncbi:hypothetical protein Tco_1530447 [Tanacetum coccineum]
MQCIATSFLSRNKLMTPSVNKTYGISYAKRCPKQDSDSELLIPTSCSDESKNEKRAKRWREKFEWKRSLFEIDLTFNINAFDLDKGTESMKDNVSQEHMCEEEGMDDHMPDEIDSAKYEQLPNHVVKKGNIEFIVCKQVANHGGDKLVDKGRPLKRKKVYAE